MLLSLCVFSLACNARSHFKPSFLDDLSAVGVTSVPGVAVFVLSLVSVWVHFASLPVVGGFAV